MTTPSDNFSCDNLEGKLRTLESSADILFNRSRNWLGVVESLFRAITSGLLVIRSHVDRCPQAA
jgi:hypothetical protein